MSLGPRKGFTRFPGNAKAFYMALCEECDMALPFGAQTERDEWALAHGDGTGHAVDHALDVAPQYSWSPFGEDGMVDVERLKAEGFTILGALKDEP